MTLRIPLYAFSLLALIVFATGCQYYIPAAPATGEASMVVEGDPFGDPFHSRAAGKDGIITEFGGARSGHAVAHASYFKLALTNQSDATWDGRYCLTLLSPEWRLIDLASHAFTVPPASGRSQEIEVTWPDTLSPGSYELALVVQRPTGPTVELNPIELNEADAGTPLEPDTVPHALVEIARARCVPAAEAYPAGSAPVGAAAEDVVRLFYWDYLQSARPDAQDAGTNPLAAASFAASPFLAPGFARQIESMVEAGAAFDPFLCAQDVPTAFEISGTTVEADAVFVHVRTSLNNEFDVVVADQGDAWRIVNVICA